MTICYEGRKSKTAERALFYVRWYKAMKRRCVKFMVGMLVLFVAVSISSAGLVYVGTYEYSARVVGYGEQDVDSDGDGGTGPIAYTTSSIQGDGIKNDDTKCALFSTGDFLQDEDGEYGEIVFDLEDDYYISSVTSYHYLRSEWWGVGAVKFYYSSDGTNYTLVGSDGSDEKGDPARTVSRTMDYNDVQARYIRLRMYRAFGDHMPLNEVEIDATAVPEPATIGLMLLSLIGLLRRER